MDWRRTGAVKHCLTLGNISRYDPKENKWTKVAPMTTRRLGVAVAVLGGYLYAIGGSDGQCPLNTGTFCEIGVEELPYQFIAPALAVLKDSAEQLLKDQRLAFQSVRTLGTPRRLTLVVEGLATQQTSMVKEAMGPSKAVAFDQAGQPTRAATGFAAGQGVAVHELQIRQTPKGEYLFAVKQEQGRPANVVLKELLPQLIAKLSFPKAMKWNQTGVRLLDRYGGWWRCMEGPCFLSKPRGLPPGTGRRAIARWGLRRGLRFKTTNPI